MVFIKNNYFISFIYFFLILLIFSDIIEEGVLMKDISGQDVQETINNIAKIKKLAQNNPRYGFNDDFNTFINKMLCLTPQSYGMRLQRYFIEKFGFTVLKAHENIGDFKDLNNDPWELKISIITPSNNSLNLVQLRPWQAIKGYYCVVIDTTSSSYQEHIFKLTKEEMAEECDLMKATAAHGTKHANTSNENVELRLSLNTSSTNEHFSRWIKKYKVNTLSLITKKVA